MTTMTSDPLDEKAIAPAFSPLNGALRRDLRAELEAYIDPGENTTPLPPAFPPLRTVVERGWLDTNKRPPPMPQLLTTEDKPFLPLGRLAMLAAPGGVGKTQLLMQLAVSVATGKPWLGTYKVATPGPVVALFGEEDADEFHRRLWRCVTGLGLCDDKDAMRALGLNLFPVPLYGAATGFADGLVRALATRNDWRLIILDPASRFMGPGCETDNKAATVWLAFLERLTQDHGNPALLIAHHTNKGALKGETDQGAARGSSALTDGVRWQANLDRVFEIDDKGKPGKVVPTRCTLRIVKRNYGPTTPALELERDYDNGGYLFPASAATLATEGRGVEAKGMGRDEPITRKVRI